MRDAFENKTETITFTVEEATMNKLREKFEDVNVNECPWFDVQDRHGNAARYYREDAYHGTGKRTAKTAQNVYDSDLISRKAATDAADEIIARDESGNNDVVKALRAWKAYIKALPPAQPDEEKEIKRLRELAARILGKYEKEKKKQLAAVRLASLRESERDRAKELQARTEREIENLRKEIKGE